MTEIDTKRLRDLLARLRHAATTEINDDRTEPMSEKRARMADRVETMNDAHDAIESLQSELTELRQACWDARAVLGFDNDGDPTPAALTFPKLADLVRRDAAEFREQYNEACKEWDEETNRRIAAERASKAAREALTTIRDSTFRNAMQLRAIADRALSPSPSEGANDG